jgi:hypothetical protein
MAYAPPNVSLEQTREAAAEKQAPLHPWLFSSHPLGTQSKYV